MHFNTGRSSWHTTNFCFDFSNTVQHAHVQPLTLSTASCKVEVLRLRSKFRQVGGQPNQELCFSFGQKQSATAAGSTGFAGLTFHISLTAETCARQSRRSAVRHRPISAQNCIFVAIIDCLKLWSEEETILFNKA